MKIKIFTMPTCAPCKALKEDLEKNKGLWEESNTPIIFTEIDLDNPEIADEVIKYNVRSAPTIIVLDDEEKVVYNGTLIRTHEQLWSKVWSQV